MGFFSEFVLGKLVWFKCIHFVNRGDQIHKYIVERAGTLKTVYFRELLDIFIMEEVYPETVT